MIVENRDQQIVVCDDSEVFQPQKEQLTFGDHPAHGKHLKFNNCAVKACWWSVNCRKSFLVLSNGYSGVSREAIVLVLDEG